MPLWPQLAAILGVYLVQRPPARPDARPRRAGERLYGGEGARPWWGGYGAVRLRSSRHRALPLEARRGIASGSIRRCLGTGWGVFCRPARSA